MPKKIGVTTSLDRKTELAYITVLFSEQSDEGFNDCAEVGVWIEPSDSAKDLDRRAREKAIQFLRRALEQCG